MFEEDGNAIILNIEEGSVQSNKEEEKNDDTTKSKGMENEDATTDASFQVTEDFDWTLVLSSKLLLWRFVCFSSSPPTR